MTTSSNPLALTIGAILALYTLASVARGLNLAPVLHNASWSGALLIVGSGLVPYPTLSFRAWLLILASILIFNLILSTRTNEATKGKPSQASGKDSTSKGAYSESFISAGVYRTIIAVYAFGLIVYLASIASTFGLNTLITDAGSIRQDTSARYLEAFPLYGKLAFYLGPLAFVLTVFPDYVRRSRTPSTANRLVLAGALLLSQVVVLQRTNIFVCLVWLAGLLLLRYERRPSLAPSGSHLSRMTRLAGLGIIALLAFQGIASAVGKTGTDNSQVNANVSATLQGNSASSILLYWSSGVPAFDSLIHSRNPEPPPETTSSGSTYGDWNPQTYGRASIAGIAKVIPGVQEWNSIAPFVRVPVPTNVYTWMEPWYRDFREAGVLFGVAFLSLILRTVCERAKASPRAQCLGGLLVGLTAFAPFINRYMTVMSLLLYVAIWLGGRFSRTSATRIGRSVALGHKSRTMLN